jgi:hypothetical protein
MVLLFPRSLFSPKERRGEFMLCDIQSSDDALATNTSCLVKISVGVVVYGVRRLM